MPRILLVTQDFPPERGGIQTYCLELVQALIRSGSEVSVLTVGKRGMENPVPSAKVVERIRIHSSWLFVPLLWRLPRLLQRERFDAVIYAQWQAALPELLMRRSVRRHQALVLVHGRELLTSVLGPLAKPLRRRVFARVEHALPNSRAVRDLLIEKAGLELGQIHSASGLEGSTSSDTRRPRISLCHPGVDTQKFHPPEPMEVQGLRERYGLEGKRIILCLTRMVARKNVIALVEAMPRILRECPQAYLVLCGGGPEKTTIEAKVRALELESAVLFPGRIAEAELAAHYGMADVFALPALQPEGDIEGFGIVYLEAAACGVAVVGARTGGIPDAIAEGESGLLIHPTQPHELEEALLQLLQNPQMAQNMGQKGRIRAVAYFTWDRTADTVLTLLQK
jgi:phosphatidyl-myo-inositol dimannoside synthase